jgi:hypothetical protein
VKQPDLDHHQHTSDARCRGINWRLRGKETVADTVAGTGLDGLVCVRRRERYLIERTREAKWVRTSISGPERSAKPLCAGSIPARASKFPQQLKSLMTPKGRRSVYTNQTPAVCETTRSFIQWVPADIQWGRRIAQPTALVSGASTDCPASTASRARRKPCLVVRAGLGASSIYP